MLGKILFRSVVGTGSSSHNLDLVFIISFHTVILIKLSKIIEFRYIRHGWLVEGFLVYGQ